MTLYLKCGEICLNIKAIANRLTCTCNNAPFCPKTKDKLTMTLRCFTEKDPHQTKSTFLDKLPAACSTYGA